MLPAVKLPREFRFHADPSSDGNHTTVSWDTPQEKKVLGVFPIKECRLSLLLHAFPDMQIGMFIKGFMHSVQLPTKFDLSAAPEKSHIRVNFSVHVDTPTGPSRFQRSRTVNTGDWSLSELGFFLRWVQEASEEASKRKSA